MFLGFFFALAACFLWGTIFVVPQSLAEFSLMEVALGRYAAYGLLSLGLFLFKGPLYFFKRYPLKIWTMAFTFALVANIVYYIGVVIGLRYATPPITVLVVGLCPILAALYGNWEVKETPFRNLTLPCLAIGFGIFLVNFTEINEGAHGFDFKEYLIGITGAIVALVSWSWFAVKNAQFLKANTEMPRTDWATLIGVASLFWATLLTIFLSIGQTPLIDVAKFTTLCPSFYKFLIGMTILGVVCAWLGCFLWNHASTLLPLSIMGPFIIFETIFGLTFVFIYESRFPSYLESFGIISMLAGISLAVLSLRKKSLSH